MDMDTDTDTDMDMEKRIKRIKIFKMQRFIIITLFVVAYFSICGQNTGPGGIASSSTLQVWLDASKLSLSDTDPVSQWGDSSGNNNHFTQTDPSLQPEFRSISPINSGPGVRFVKDFLYSSPIPSLETNDLSCVISGRIGFLLLIFFKTSSPSFSLSLLLYTEGLK